ncbi:ATP-binding cassette domain-containing protein [Propionimicrobium sp. PCR01-08-3]|uniref:ATP-binding cassette domain-containing protein n=1 Tax=Propionimicrobium sp. PCR01-08-3 TaxID=3052086 RepID=UPI00255C818F|nr:ATP-binding cassette domain-containing protein [Propionimicrobium sp. PCR01-08-3]WIY82334.1 ATP-binding cassette domain-containing protein [Propionimicrobium sp. PCR01-08-3]
MTSDEDPDGDQVAPAADLAAGTGGSPVGVAPETAAGDVPAVECRKISKAFGSVQALDGVDLVLRRGTVHALVGENGSGKSTLTKIIAGAHAPDSGQIIIGGTEIEAITPRDAIAHGVRVIYQDLALFPNMTVAENIAFEGGARPFGKAPGKQAVASAAAALPGWAQRSTQTPGWAICRPPNGNWSPSPGPSPATARSL